MPSVEVLLPNHLAHGFDYAVPEGMALHPGDYVRVPFGGREMAGVVWGPGDAARASGRLKPVAAHYAHLPPMSEATRAFLDWAAWYTCSPRGAVLKMSLPVAEALKAPTPRERPPAVSAAEAPPPRALSAEQKEAAEALIRRLHAGFSVTLLDGVTGSGKTEVYFEAMARISGTGEDTAVPPQCLVLLPEISLSVQWLERFQARFGMRPVVWHSGLPPGLRKHSWRAIADGTARVVVGARSALFLPYRNLQLIVADEEHDHSYKQEEGVIYHARDMAVARARHEKIPALLVSATPSLETWHNAKTGKYATLHLRARHAGAQLPEIALVDMRAAALERGAFLAQPLRQALADNMRLGHQSLLFLNRRGYAPLLLCRACGHRFQCPQCTSWLVVHRKKAVSEKHLAEQQPLATGHFLQCHHCGYTAPPPPRCPSCQAEDCFSACGPGVERVAEEVAAFLPQARLAVLASDSTENFDALQERIHAMQRGDIDILIGTQMIAKGHHFERLALVGVVDADLGLSGGDLRAAERTYQLLHQISGRAGRARVAGRVMLQSFQPGHPVMQALIRDERELFMQLELEERRAARMPPFARLCAVIVEGTQEAAVAGLARDLARTAPRMREVQLLGPAQAPLYMLRGRFRQRLLLRAERQVNLQAYLAQWMGEGHRRHNLKVKIDIDPYGFL